MPLISIAGSQGSGKSTILNVLADRGFKIVGRKTSRSILSDWGVTLQEVNNDPELTTKFQDEIIHRKLQDEAEAAASDDVWFTERTYADLFTYALVALGHNNIFSSYIDGYYTACKSAQQTHAYTFYLRAGKFPVVADGVRGINQHYSSMVDVVMLDVLQKFVQGPGDQVYDKLEVLEMGLLNERIDRIIKVVSNRLGHKV